MTAPLNVIRPSVRERVLRGVNVAFTFVTVFAIGATAIVSASLVSRLVAVAASQGDLIPLLAVVGTGAVLFVGWKIVSPSRGKR